LLVVDHLAAPYPAYISLQTALYRHGMIEQIPNLIYAVTLGRTRRVTTTVGIYSLHHLLPELFGGYVIGDDGVKQATPEKTLVDMAWLSSAKSRLFSAVPELTLPPRFRRRAAAIWARRLTSPRARTLVTQRFAELLNAAQA
jgi:hypothetical protein